MSADALRNSAAFPTITVWGASKRRDWSRSWPWWIFEVEIGIEMEDCTK